MDGTPLYPEGFHPSAQAFKEDMSGIVKHLNRCDVDQVKYYVVDFGLSKRFEDPKQRRLVRGAQIQDHDVPEVSDVVPYDPFPVDVFTLGNIFKKDLLQVSGTRSPRMT